MTGQIVPVAPEQSVEITPITATDPRDHRREAAPSAADAATVKPPRRYSIRISLMALVVACVLPALLVCAGLVFEDYRLHQERIYRDTILMARNFSASLDRELSGVEYGLRILATSQDLATGDLASFHQRARDALKFAVVDNYFVANAAGHQLLNTLIPFDAQLPPPLTKQPLHQVLEVGALVLTDLFVGQLAQAPMVAMGVPVFRANEVVYSLNAGLSADRIGEVFNHQRLPDGWIAAVVDGSGTIVARTHEAKRFVGQKTFAPLFQRMSVDREGTMETITNEGIPVVTAFSRSSISNWSVAVGAPKALLTTQLWRAIAWIAAAAAVAFIIGMGMATRLAHIVTGSVRGLMRPVLALGSGQPVAPPETRLEEVDAVGKALVRASEMLKRVQHLAYHDALTGLPNRLLFNELGAHQIALARRNQTTIAVFAIDLDEFKAVNDSQGHAMGDSVLKIAVDRIRASIRASDIAARLGGDEFAVLLGAADLDAATVIAEKLVAILAEPYPDIAPPVSASIGVALFPRSGATVADLLKRADRALYKAKRLGKHCVALDI